MEKTGKMCYNSKKYETKRVFMASVFYCNGVHAAIAAAAKQIDREKEYVVFADDHRAHGYTDLKSLGYAKGYIFKDTLAVCGHGYIL